MEAWKQQLVAIKRDLAPAFFSMEGVAAGILEAYLLDDLKERESIALAVVRAAGSNKFGSMSDYELRMYEELIHCKLQIRKIRSRQHGLSGKRGRA